MMFDTHRPSSSYMRRQGAVGRAAHGVRAAAGGGSLPPGRVLDRERTAGHCRRPGPASQPPSGEQSLQNGLSTAWLNKGACMWLLRLHYPSGLDDMPAAVGAARLQGPRIHNGYICCVSTTSSQACSMQLDGAPLGRQGLGDEAAAERAVLAVKAAKLQVFPTQPDAAVLVLEQAQSRGPRCHDIC